MNTTTSATKKPNVVLILNDDMGYSDLGCYGGEIETPNLDRLAANGLRFSSFYNTARCSPSRASMLTGLHPHQTGVGILTYDSGPEGYAGNLNHRCVTIPQVLKANGYRTYMSGKWHVASNLVKPTDAWPLQRGFDEFYGTIIGAGSFYDPNTLTRGNDNVEHEAHAEGFFYTDAISDQAVEYIERHARERPEQPFFEYVAYTAPHWPLHAHEEDIARYDGRFDAGWDQLRQERLDRLVASGLLKEHWKLTERDPTQPPWSEAEKDAQFRAWTLRCMEVYAAQVDRMDQGIGRILAALERTGQLDDTLVIFLADNGACAEDIPEDVTIDELVDKLMIARRTTRSGEPVHIGNDILRMPGPENTYQSYGTAWANLSNAPFRLYKHWIHEGGISTPLIVHWPKGIAARGELRHATGHVVDFVPTILDVAGSKPPAKWDGKDVPPAPGRSLVPIFAKDSALARESIWWLHEGNRALRAGDWKIVAAGKDAPWELYDASSDRSETKNLAGAQPDKLKELVALWTKQFEDYSALALKDAPPDQKKDPKK
jgi:arylsulfatase